MKQLVTIIMLVLSMNVNASVSAEKVNKIVTAEFSAAVDKADAELAAAVKRREERVLKATKTYIKELTKLKKYYTRKSNLEKAMEYKAIIDKLQAAVDKGNVVEKVNTPTSPATKSLIKGKNVKLVIWNCHNANAGDRGSKKVVVKAYVQGKEVWSKKITLKWSPTKDYRKSVTMSSKFDEIKIYIEEWVGNGGGLSEVQVIDGGVNLAEKATVTSSKVFGGFPASNINDGITNSDKKEGYWLLTNATKGWISLKF